MADEDKSEETEGTKGTKAKEDTDGKEHKPSKSSTSPALAKIVGEIEKLSVLELSQLVKSLEEKFGVSAAPQVAMAPSGQAAQTGADGPVEEQTTFNVILTDSGATKISVIKALREINPQLGLKEAKDITDSTPKEILTGVNKENAQEAKQKLETAGAKVELK